MSWTAATTLKRVIELLEEEQGIKIDDIRVELPGVDKTLNILERVVLKEAMGRSVRKNPGESISTTSNTVQAPDTVVTQL
jgi:hypothetical protein